MRSYLIRLVLAVRRASVPFLKGLLVLIVILSGIVGWMYWSYEDISKEARAEELAFWDTVDAMTLEDRAALLSYSIRTGTLPHVLPWWEHDRHMCSAVVVKYIVLFTGIKLVHSSAWEVREKKACSNCVSNARKLTTLWDGTEFYGADGSIELETRNELVQQVESVATDPDKVYIIGILWAGTSYWDDMQADQADINSHVALLMHGHVIHFFADNGEHPLRLETFEEMFSNQEFSPVWIAEVHKKTRARAPDWVLTKQDLRLPRVEHEIAFEQNVWPWPSLQRWLVFPSRPWFAGGRKNEIFQRADALVEKSLLFRLRNGYDIYPTTFQPTEVQP